MSRLSKLPEMTIRRTVFLTGIALLYGMMTFLMGCAPSLHVLGAIPDEKRLTSIASLRASTPAMTSPVVTLRGKMVEKCPVAACWFRLRDKTGEVKVDLKGAYFTVTETPLGSEVTVSGRWVKSGDDPVLAATGLQY